MAKVSLMLQFSSLDVAIPPPNTNNRLYTIFMRNIKAPVGYNFIL
ncbi:hypothetical protein Mucpa_3774 [Mucilaginibacter paludis DSM 18603]|uniref:Uncharacterized protein n=1 Tax=Mucilaginibacter paludis DSM 18603 TaxID=714943 RepID=H1Y292_9SPHI|nr:hypothetical protein Mucpa_3774 [Mucilaginibacter paludis DSM 18603]